MQLFNEKKCFNHRLLCLHNRFLLLKKALEMQLVSVFYKNLSIYKGKKIYLTALACTFKTKYQSHGGLPQYKMMLFNYLMRTTLFTFSNATGPCHACLVKYILTSVLEVCLYALNTHLCKHIFASCAFNNRYMYYSLLKAI